MNIRQEGLDCIYEFCGVVVRGVERKNGWAGGGGSHRSRGGVVYMQSQISKGRAGCRIAPVKKRGRAGQCKKTLIGMELGLGNETL